MSSFHTAHFYEEMLFSDHLFCYLSARIESGRMPYCFLSPAAQHSETLAQNKYSSTSFTSLESASVSVIILEL